MPVDSNLRQREQSMRGNNRNGHGDKRVLTESGSVDVSVNRDPNASFEPQLVRKGQSCPPGFDEKVISLYARGMTQREIRGHLEEHYAIAVSPDLISRVTDAVLEEVKAARHHDSCDRRARFLTEGLAHPGIEFMQRFWRAASAVLRWSSF